MATIYDNEQLLLNAVNILLQSINEQALLDEADLLVSLEGQEAQRVLDEVRLTVLSKGWNFNTDEGYEFMPDLDGFINIPYNVLDIASSTGNMVMREWQLYDKDGQTRKFTEAVSCTVVWNMDFNNITHPIRHYITIRAARIYQARFIGDVTQHRFSQEDEIAALQDAKESEGRTGKYNMLSSDFGVTSLSRL